MVKDFVKDIDRIITENYNLPVSDVELIRSAILQIYYVIPNANYDVLKKKLATLTTKYIDNGDEANYDYRRNKLEIDDGYMENASPEEIMEALRHEMLHMASTRDSKRTFEFGLAIVKGKEVNYELFNEGFTQFLALYTGNPKENGSYVFETAMAKIITNIMGFDNMVNAYFDEGIEKLFDIAKEKGIYDEFSYIITALDKNSEYTRGDCFEEDNPVFAEIQKNAISMFEKHMMEKISSGITDEEYKEELQKFEECLFFTSEKVDEMQLDIEFSNLENICEVEENWGELVERMNMVQDCLTV